MTTTPTSKRDLEKTRRRILDAAAREFADKGLAGARVDAVAKKARVNKAMIYYIFGGKEDLHLAVLEHLFEEKIAKVDSRVSELDFSTDDFLAVFDLYFDAFFERRDYVRIMINDAVTGARTLRRLRDKRPDLFAIVDTLSALFDRSMRRGAIRRTDSDKSLAVVILLLASLVCMLPHMDVLRPRKTAAHRELTDQERWKAFLRNSLELSLRPPGA